MKTTFFSWAMLLAFATLTLSSKAQNSVPPQGDCENLFFSEITFGKNPNGNLWDLNYAVEIYNPTPNTINLSNYELLLTDLTLNTYSFPLSGTIASGDVHVVSNSNADYSLQMLADQLSSGLDFELYACLELKQNGVVLDKIGQKFSNSPNGGFDPVQMLQDPYGYLQNYDINLNDYENITLRRSFFDKQGDPVFSPASTALIGHWSFHVNTDLSNIGTHKCECIINPESTDQVIGFLSNNNHTPTDWKWDLNNVLDNHALIIYFQTSFPPGITQYDVNPTYLFDNTMSTASFGVSQPPYYNDNIGLFYYAPSGYQSNGFPTPIVRNLYVSSQINNLYNEFVTYGSNKYLLPSDPKVACILLDTSTYSPDPNVDIIIDQARNRSWIYFHTLAPFATNSFSKENVLVYPTIFYDNVSIKSEGQDLRYEVLGLGGQVLSKGQCSKGENIISLQHLSTGMYILNLYSKSEQYSVKLRKQ